MKKHKLAGRLLASALMLVLTVSLLPVGIHATKVTQGLVDDSQKDTSITDAWWWVYKEEEKDNDKPQKIKLEDYEKYITPFVGDDRDVVYELVGLGTWDSEDKPRNNVTAIDVPPFPVDGTEAEKKAWHDTYDVILVAYMKHTHDLTDAPWFFDNNYHWKYCQKCKKRVFLEWHTDKNDDGICDLCDNPIHYYNITVKDAPGGKVTVSASKGAMNDRVDVTVTPDAGYHLAALRFVNDNGIHSQLTRWEDKAGSDYHFVILNWDIEIEAEFEKD